MNIESLVTRLFAEHESFRWRGQKDSPIDEVHAETLYRTDVHDGEGLRYDAQVYVGLGQMGGHFWEQDVRVLLRIATMDHPALQRVEAGGYDDDLDAAYVVTTRAPYNLAEMGDPALAAIRADRPRAMSHFEQLVEGLGVLHSQGLLHRNIWPGTVRFTDLEQLRLSRFEMSVLVANVLRGAGDADVAEQRALFMRQPMLALLHTAPERLDELLVDGAAEYLETGAADVFALGVMAATWFVADIEVPRDDEELRRDAGTLRGTIASFHSGLLASVRRAERRGELSGALADVITSMLDPHPPSRKTAHAVTTALLKHRDETLGLWEERPDEHYLVIFIPDEWTGTLYRWGELLSDPADATGQGGAELRELIETDLRRGSVAHSPTGARGYVTSGSNPDALAAADVVLLGSRFAWFCQPYRAPDPITRALGEEWAEALVIKFVTDHSRAHYVRALPHQRSLPSIQAVRSDQDPADLERERRRRPSWIPLLSTTQTKESKPQWQHDWIDGFEWLLDLRRAEMTVGTFPFNRENADPTGRTAELVEDPLRRRKLLSKSGIASELAESIHNPTLGDYLDDLGDEGEETGIREGARIVYWEGDRPNPPWGSPSRGTAQRLDPERARVVREDKARPLPQQGMLRSSDHEGTPQSLRRQERAVAELAASPGLLRQFQRPQTIRGFTRRWRHAGAGLRGGADKVVMNFLASQPFYALHGPPGTGKTTVVAHAVAAYLEAEPGSRVLISAQSNAALDHIALRILDQLKAQNVRYLPLRVTTSAAAGNLRPELAELQIEQSTDRLASELDAHVGERLQVETDPALRTLLTEWRDTVHRVHAELRLRIHNGANVVFATCEGATTETLGHRGALPPFDWVIVEEAAKAWPTELAIPLMRATRWALIGDHRQLPAYRREEVDAFFDRCATSQRPDLQKYVQRQDSIRSAFDLFGGLFTRTGGSEKEPLEMLTHQFRMSSPIAAVVSRAFYGGTLTTDASADARDHGLTEPEFLRDRSLVWLDTTGWSDQDEPFWHNEREAELVQRLVSALRPDPFDRTDWDALGLVVLTPYHAQRRHLVRLGVRDVHTVHSFQGSEAEIVIVSLVRTTERGGPLRSLGHLSKPEVANVLLSRARRLLILVGRFDHFRSANVEHWQQICNTVEDVGDVVSWQDAGLLQP